MFEGEWEQRSLFGWETAICKIYGEPVQNPGADAGDNNEDENDEI